MTKEEKIKEAYNNAIILEVVDENGWNQKRIFNQGEIDNEKFDYETVGHGIYISRPKSLKGIENNNGWVKIYCENDMPQFDCHCFIMDKQKGLVSGLWKQAPNEIEDKKARAFWMDKATHYKIISEPNLPLY